MALALLPALPPEPARPAPLPSSEVLLRGDALDPFWQHRFEPPAPPKGHRHLRRYCRCRTRCKCPQPEPRRTDTNEEVYTTRHFCRCDKVCSCRVLDILFKSKSVLTQSLTKTEKAARTGTSNTLRVHQRPVTRGDCVDGVRPCPWVSCAEHLYLDVNPENGSIKYNFPMLNPWNLKETCALDVADRGGVTLEEVGELLNISMERIRQVEVDGAAKLREALEAVPRDSDWWPDEEGSED